MQTCTICGFRNPDTNVRCLKCSGILHRDQLELAESQKKAHEKLAGIRKQIRFSALQETLERKFPSWQLPQDRPFRYPFTAGLLSLVPGLGQLYNFQSQKAVLLFLISLLLIMLSIVTITQPYSNWLLLITAIAWVLIWNDAIATAIRMNGQTWSLRNSLAMFFGILFIIGMLMNGLQFFGMSFLTLVRVRQPVHLPEIAAMDRLWVNHMAYWFRKPRVGDVIYFDPKRFSAEKGNSMYSINIKRYFQRIIAEGGDVIEKKEGVFLRNGSPLPKRILPFGSELLPDMKYKVPAGRYFAPVTRIPQDTLAQIIVTANSGEAVHSAFQDGFVLQGWEESAMVEPDEIWGRAVAIVDPPTHRKWLGGQ